LPLTRRRAEVLSNVIANPDESPAAWRLPLLERDGELRRIAGVVRDPVGGRGTLVLIEGPAGIGRSRLLREVADRGKPPADRSRRLMVLDDVQRCDRAGAEQLGRQIADARSGGAVVLLACRSGEAHSADAWAPERLRGDRSAVIVRLGPLSERSVGVLLTRVYGADPDRGFVTTCHRVTGGNPALVHELALRLVELAVAPVESNAGIVERLAVPPVGRRALERLSSLDPSGATALVIACAVLGDAAPLAHAVALADLDEGDAGSALAALRRREVLVPGDCVRFAQPLVARSILAAVRPSELCRWHSRAAEVLDAADTPIEEIAAHLMRGARAGDRTSVGRLRLGAHRARQIGDCAAAAALLRRALEEGVPEFEPDLFSELAEVCAPRSPAGD
jgi:hypothetical protein